MHLSNLLETKLFDKKDKRKKNNLTKENTSKTANFTEMFIVNWCRKVLLLFEVHLD